MFFVCRFLFILLGPKGKAKSYHEIGRAIATLMSDEVEIPLTSNICISSVYVMLPTVKTQKTTLIIISLSYTVQVFHDIAYKAKDRQDLLAGIDEFLDEVIVLPPGEWDPAIRIEPPKNLPPPDKRSKPSR